MSLYDRPPSWDDHPRRPAAVSCPDDGAELLQVGGSSLLHCPRCGESRFLVAS